MSDTSSAGLDEAGGSESVSTLEVAFFALYVLAGLPSALFRAGGCAVARDLAACDGRRGEENAGRRGRRVRRGLPVH